MGLYPIDCPSCGKPFMWFSGNLPDQSCDACKQANPATLSQETLPDVAQSIKVTETTIIKNSSNISAVSYTNTDDLVVTFSNGGEYLYKNVPKEVYQNMITSKSVGKYLTEAVKGKFKYEKLDKPTVKAVKIDETTAQTTEITVKAPEVPPKQ